MIGEQLMARLGLDASGFKAGLKGAESALGSFKGQVGIGLSVAGLAQFTKDIVEYGARVYDLGQRFGVSTTAIQTFGNAAEKNGSSLEGMTMGFNKLEISISRALGGNDKVSNSFAALGITLDDLRKLSPEEVMLKLGKSSMNAADMVTLLGRTALQLRPVLAGLADDTIKLGDAINKHMIIELKKSDDTYKTLWQHIRIGGSTALVGIKKDFTDVVTIISAGSKTLRAIFSENSEEASKNYGKMMEAVRSQQDILLTGGKNNRKKEEADDDAAAKKRRKFPPSDPDGSPSKSEQDADRKEGDRTKLSLAELQKLDPKKDVELANNIQAVFAAQQAKEVERLEASSKRKAALNDPLGARGDLNRADQMRQGIPNLKDSDKQLGQFKTALDGCQMAKDINALLGLANEADG